MLMTTAHHDHEQELRHQHLRRQQQNTLRHKHRRLDHQQQNKKCARRNKSNNAGALLFGIGLWPLDGIFLVRNNKNNVGNYLGFDIITLVNPLNL